MDCVEPVEIGFAGLVTVIGADFGAEGHVIIPLIEQEIQCRVTPDIAFSVTYSPLEWKNFAQGAPLLIFADYFTEIEAGIPKS